MTTQHTHPIRLVRRSGLPVTTDRFDAEVMLAKAEAGAYPAAAHGSPERRKEVDYWRERVRQQAGAAQGQLALLEGYE